MGKLTGKITAINAGKNPRTGRSNIFLDGKFAFSLDNEVITRKGLKIGAELSPEAAGELNGADNFQRCLNAAFNLLSYRPRSEAETRLRLRRRGFESPDVEKAISELKRLELINDAGFAEFWKENRNSFKPRSQRMIKQELRQKGVETDIIKEIVEDIDDSANAYRLASERALKLPEMDYLSFNRKLGGYLQRRGFTYGIITNVIKQVWKDKLSQTHEPQNYYDGVDSSD